MIDKQEVLNLIYAAFDEINEQLPKSKRLQKQENETLFGENGKLDSLGLVNLIVSIEGLIDEEYEQSITLADEKAMSMKNSPFQSVTTLCNYIIKLMEEDN